QRGGRRPPPGKTDLRWLRLIRFSGFLFLLLHLARAWCGPRAADIDRRRVERVLDVSGVEFLDHLDAGAAVLGDLIDVGAFHEAHTYVGVSQAVGCAPVPVAIELKAGAREHAVEQFDVVARKDVIGWFRQLGCDGCRRLADIFASAAPGALALSGSR